MAGMQIVFQMGEGLERSGRRVRAPMVIKGSNPVITVTLAGHPVCPHSQLSVLHVLTLKLETILQESDYHDLRNQVL